MLGESFSLFQLIAAAWWDGFHNTSHAINGAEFQRLEDEDREMVRRTCNARLMDFVAKESSRHIAQEASHYG